MIKTLVLDVDGCLTDGGLFYDNSGSCMYIFNVKDGLSIVSWLKLGREVIIMSGNKSVALENRAKKLGIKHIYQDVKDKEYKLNRVLKNKGLGFDDVAAIGDDLNDYGVLKQAKLSFMPNDGSRLIKEVVDVVLKTDGGKGAVREMIEYILDKECCMKDFLALWV